MIPDRRSVSEIKTDLMLELLRLPFAHDSLVDEIEALIRVIVREETPRADVRSSAEDGK